MRIRILPTHKCLHIFLGCFLFISLFFSCKKKVEIPADILSPNKMTEILVDVHLNESMITNERYRRDSLSEIVSTFYCNIFEKHSITEQEFRKSLDYYTTHLDEMKKIYKEVVAELNKEE